MKLVMIDNQGRAHVIVERLEEWDLGKPTTRSSLIEDVHIMWCRLIYGTSKRPRGHLMHQRRVQE